MSTVRWSPVSSHMMNGAPGSIVCGAPGSGKTFFLLNIAANCIGTGQKVIAIDPKNDFTKLYNVNPHIKIIDINNIQPGSMNPFTFFNTMDEAGNIVGIDSSTLLTIIELLCGKDKIAPHIVAITPIVTDFVTKSKNSDEYVDMLDVADYLFANKSEDARIVGTLLKLYEDNPKAQLIFSRDPNPHPLILSSTDSMVISIHGMALPDYNKKESDYEPNERLTSTILYLLTNKLLSILSEDSKIPTTLICDEAHVLFGNKSMKMVIDKFLTLGRSLNVATVMASQGISHFPDDTSNYITSKFLFKSSLDEARMFLERFVDRTNNVDVDSIVSSVTKFPTGVCYFMDRTARNGIIKIKSIYDPKLLTSNPFAKKRDKIDAKEE